MTDEQWEKLLAIIGGEVFEPLPVGFIVDSPWLANWAGMSILDYFTNEQKWLEANLKVVGEFEECFFLPGFWAEFGMCTGPAAFGAKCIWPENEFPSVGKLAADIEKVADIKKPNAETDGLCPFVIKRLKNCLEQIERAGHRVRFAVSRGPLNIASFLLGTTEFLTALKLNPKLTHKMLNTITDFIIDWLKVQKEAFGSVDGIFILDDIAGFLGEKDFKEFALSYFRRIFDSFDVNVKFFHNDSNGVVCAPYLSEIGVNLFNFSFNHSINEMRQLTQNEVTLLGNIPPVDVLANGSAQKVKDEVGSLVSSLSERSRVILSCGGGMPPGVSSENIKAFLAAVNGS